MVTLRATENKRFESLVTKVFYWDPAPKEGSELDVAIKASVQEAASKIHDQTNGSQHVFSDNVLGFISDELCKEFDADVRITESQSMLDPTQLFITRAFTIRVHPHLIESFEHRHNDQLVDLLNQIFPNEE